MFATLFNELTGLGLKTYDSLGYSKWKVLFYGMTEEYFFAQWDHQRYKYSVSYTIIHEDQGCLSCQ